MRFDCFVCFTKLLLCAIAIICYLTECGYHEVEVSLILVLGILERLMLQNTSTGSQQQDNPLLIFARFLGKVRIESIEKNATRNDITKKYADEMLSRTAGDCLRNRLAIGVGSSLSPAVYQIAITHCRDRPDFTTTSLLWLRQPHIHNLMITTRASQYLTESLTAPKSKGTVAKSVKTFRFVIPGHTMAIDELFNPENPEDVSTVFRELCKITLAKHVPSELVVWNIPDLLPYIANHMTAVQQDIPPYPVDSSSRSQQTAVAAEKGLWVLRCLILRDADYYHNKMAVRAMENVPSRGEFDDRACEFVFHNIPRGTFCGTTPRAVAVVFDPTFDFTHFRSIISGYQTLRSLALPVVVWYMLMTFGFPLKNYSTDKVEDDVIDALSNNNNLNQLGQLPEPLRRLIWGKDFNIFQSAAGTAAVVWDICANPAKNTAGAPLNYAGLSRPASQPVSHLSKKRKKGNNADDASSDDGNDDQQEEEEEAEMADDKGIYNGIVKYVEPATSLIAPTNVCMTLSVLFCFSIGKC